MSKLPDVLGCYDCEVFEVGHLRCSARICFLTASYLWFMYRRKLDATSPFCSTNRLCASIDRRICSDTLAKRNVYRGGSPDAVDILIPYTTSPAPARLAAHHTQLAPFPAEDGFDGELPYPPISPTFHRYTPRSPTTTSATMPICMPVPIPTQVPEVHNALTSIRKVITTSNPSGSATSHVVVRCTLADIAHSMNLRVEDACGCWT
ncbi:hypothetical protein EDC04DRAFT_2788299 [Pisolithus marmoratus]|nr:hypothetical protein EDC04DRAFT_2788299 [Pisolithus marmoratus]